MRRYGIGRRGLHRKTCRCGIWANLQVPARFTWAAAVVRLGLGCRGPAAARLVRRQRGLSACRSAGSGPTSSTAAFHRAVLLSSSRGVLASCPGYSHTIASKPCSLAILIRSGKTPWAISSVRLATKRIAATPQLLAGWSDSLQRWASLPLFRRSHLLWTF